MAESCLSLDYSRISKTPDVLLLSPTLVLEHEAYWPWRIRRGPLTAADQALGYTGGPITEIDATAFNGASLLVQTLNARLDWTTGLPIGGLHVYAAATYHFEDAEGACSRRTCRPPDTSTAPWSGVQTPAPTGRGDTDDRRQPAVFRQLLRVSRC